jgi:hypothetical protein
MDNNHADALLNMELEAKLQERLFKLIFYDPRFNEALMGIVRERLINDRSFAICLQKTMASAIQSSQLY